MGKDAETELLEEELLDEEDVIEEDEDELTEDSETEDDVEDEDEDEETPKSKKKSGGTPKFTKEQQEAIDKIVQSRLDRAERQFEQRFKDAAGADVNRADFDQAANLWGFLKLNPQLSENVQRLIDEYIAKGNYVEQKKRPGASREGELGRREAILDLKADDSYFAKNSKAILDWAEDEGFDITDAKSLKRAYMAYKGARGALDRADREHRKKQQAKTPAKKGAKVAMSKGSAGGKKNVDYRKMSDTDVLAASGLSLFTDD